MDRITTDTPGRPDGEEESKLPASPSSIGSGKGPEMEFDKKDDHVENDNDCISHVEANCCNAITNNVSRLCESNRWILTALSRLFFLGNIILFEYLYVSKSIRQMMTREQSTAFIVVSFQIRCNILLILDIHDYGQCISCTLRVLLR